MLKFLIPLAAGLFLVSSFLFFDGWPFRGGSDEPRPPLDAGGPDMQSSRPLPAAPAVPANDEARWEERLKSMESGDPEDFRLALSNAVLAEGLGREFRMKALARLRDVNARLVFSAQPFSRTETVAVQSGDNLTKIAGRARKKSGTNVTPAFLIKANGLKSDVLKPKDVLKVPTESLSAVVRKSDFKLYVLLGGTVVLDYDIGLGKDDSTPLGRFTIAGKTRNPTWTMPGGRVVKFGDPEHIIGTRWMGFDDDKGRTSYGIHGTTEEQTVGQMASAGCIRLRRADVEELFDILPEHSDIDIRP